MNKTVTVNISGFVFYIEEDAFNVLSSYLNRIKSIFKSDEGGDEIIDDVEARIAELFHDKLGNKKEVVIMSDVEEVISVMGKPEDYIEEEVNYSQNSGHNDDYNRSERRKIYRDQDDRILGGVSSGLSYYFNIDPLVIRIVFCILFFLGLSGGIIYIILWVIMPKAETTAEKLRMQGESINVENIKKKVNDFSESSGGGNSGSYIRNFFDKAIDLLGHLFTVIGKVLLKLIGLGFVLMAIGLLIGLIALLVSPDSVGNLNDIPFTFSEIREMIFHSSSNFYLSIIGVTLLALVPIIGLIYGAIRIFLGKKYTTRGIGTALMAIFFISAAVATVGILRTADDYRNEGEFESVLLTNNDTDKLHVKIISDDMFHSNLKVNNTSEMWQAVKLTEDKYVDGQSIEFRTRPTEGNFFKVKVTKRSQGSKSLEAITYAENISYKSRISGDTLYLAPYFTAPREDKFRAQRVRIELMVPEGKIVTMNENTERIELRHLRALDIFTYKNGERINPLDIDLEENQEKEINSNSEAEVKTNTKSLSI